MWNHRPFLFLWWYYELRKCKTGGLQDPEFIVSWLVTLHLWVRIFKKFPDLRVLAYVDDDNIIGRFSHVLRLTTELKPVFKWYEKRAAMCLWDYIQRKCISTSSVNGQHGMNPTGRYAHMFEEDKRIGVIKTTEDEMPRKSKPEISKQKLSNFFFCPT